ncbi:MAG: D-alanyl-D-alanine carboxypeptidase family protein [Syntrophomonadaceae bacterium]
MKRYIAILLAAFILFGLFPSQAVAQVEPPEVASESAVLMDAKTGQVLYEKSMHMQLYPASITKILTVLLALENGCLNDYITMSSEAANNIKNGSSNIALEEGEQITLEQAMMAAMLPSANEACNGIAENIGGSLAGFARLMNQRSREAGALNSNFINPNGLPDPNHLSTAYDMAMITRDALKYDKFREIIGTVRYTIPPTNKKTEARDLWSMHRMLTTNRYYYDGVVGGKTGYTQESKNTLVTVARRGDRELIVVVMKSDNYADYKDTIALFDYGFNEFVETNIVPAVPPGGQALLIQDVLNQHQDLNLKRLLPKGMNPQEIAIDYETVDNDPFKEPDLLVKLHLNSSSSLMYADLGTIYLINSSSKPVQDSWGDMVLKVLKILAIVVLSVAALLFIIRWFFKLRKLRKKRNNPRPLNEQIHLK